MTVLIASRILFSQRCPAVERIMFLSAVNILLGRMKLSTGRPPEIKSRASRGSTWESVFALLVIWHTIISLPGRSATTNAGRFLLSDRSVNGKGMITTSPFTNLPMPRPLPVYPSLLTRRPHLTAWFPVSARVFVALSMPQNQQLHPRKPPEESLFPVIKQRVQSWFYPYGVNIA